MLRKRLISSNHLFTLSVALLGICLSLSYPVHVVVDHTDLFGHHHSHSHSHGDHDSHSDHSLPDDELCSVCLTLSSSEMSEGVNPAHLSQNEGFTLNRVLVPDNESPGLCRERAPPA